MDNSNLESGGVGVLEPPVVGDTPPVPDSQTFPASIDNASRVPESADSSGIVDKLHEFDAKRVGDDRKVRHARSKYIDELVKTQSPVILREAASHFMTVGEDGKIKESSSVKSLRDRLVKEKGISLTSAGIDKAGVIHEQVAMYRDILAAAAEDLPEAQREHYLKRRLNPNVNAKAATLRGEGRKRRTSAESTPVAAPASAPVFEPMRPAPMDMEEVAAHAVIDRKSWQRGGHYVNPADPEDIAGQRRMVEAQKAAAEAARRAQEEAAAEARRQAETAHTQSLTDAAADAESRRKDNLNYVKPGDPDDTAGQARVREYRIQENQARQDAQRQADAAATQARIEAQRAEQRPQFDAVKVETSHGFTDAPPKRDFTGVPLPSEQTGTYFNALGEHAANASSQDEDSEAFDRVRRTKAAEAAAEASQQAMDRARNPLPSEQTDSYFAAIGVKAAEANLQRAREEAAFARGRQNDTIKRNVAAVSGAMQADALQQEYDRLKAQSDQSRQQEIANYQRPEKRVQDEALAERFRAMNAELARIEESRSQRQESTTVDRVKGFARRLRKPNNLRLFAVGTMLAATAGGTYLSSEDSHSDVAGYEDRPAHTEVLDSAQMPSEQALEENGIRIDKGGDTSGETAIGGESTAASSDESTSGSEVGDNNDTSAAMPGTESRSGGISTVSAPPVSSVPPETSSVADHVKDSLAEVGAENPLKTKDVSSGGESQSEGAAAASDTTENNQSADPIQSETVTIKAGGSWGEELSGIDGSTPEGANQIQAFLNDPANLDLIEATVLENPGDMTYTQIKEIFDGIHSGDRPQSDGWHLLDMVSADTPVQKPTESGVQSLHDDRDGIYSELLGDQGQTVSPQVQANPSVGDGTGVIPLASDEVSNPAPGEVNPQAPAPTSNGGLVSSALRFFRRNR